MARAGGGPRVALHGHVPEHVPPQAAGAQYFAMDTGEDVGDAPAAERPAPLLEVLPQVWVQRRTVEQIVDPVPVVPMLHVLVPQMVEQLVDILAPLDFRVGEQVIEVPKIVCPPRAARTVLRAPQTADQLVEVPTIISYSSLPQRTMEQNVAIPVPLGRGGRNADPPGFLRGQGPTAHSSSLERISEQIVEQIADIPVARGDPHGFRPEQSSSASSSSTAGVHGSADGPGKGVFRTFPQNKKSAKMGSHSSQRVPASVSPSTPAPQVRLADWVMVLSGERLYFWNRRTGESRWMMEDGYSPSWCLRPDGRYVRLGDGEVFETLDGS